MSDLPISFLNLQTTKRVPPSLRGTIYESMIEAVSEELALFRQQVREQKTSFYDVDTMSLDRLIEISKTFGVPFITSVKSDIDFLREEIRAIPFKIYYKGTPTLYKSFFYAVDRFGEMFIYTYQADIDSIVRSMQSPFEEASQTPSYLPFKHLSKGDFSGKLEEWVKLDSGLYLDAEDAFTSTWTLDTSSSEISTNHIGLEYFIDRIIKRIDIDKETGLEIENEYLMTSGYLEYLSQSIEFARRTKEVPHIGSQLSIQTDITGFCNSNGMPSSDPDYDETLVEYSIPSLKLKVAARSDLFDIINSTYDISHIEFGIETQPIPSIQNPVPFPIELKRPVCKNPVTFKNHLETNIYLGAIGEYLGQSLNGFKILNTTDFDGIKQNFDFNLPFAPIQRGNIILEFIVPPEDEFSTEKHLSIEDDRRGSFLSPYGSGTIDYKTGECHLATKFDYTQVESINPEIDPNLPDPTEGRTHFIHTLACEESVVKDKVWLTFTVGEGIDQRTYIVNDDGNGYFAHSVIESGTIDYDNRIIDIVFKTPLADLSEKPFNCKYSFHVDYTLPEGSILLASYYFTQQSVPITEAGFLNSAGQLLCYATFPPFEFSSTAHHLNLMILIQKPENS